MRALLSLLFLTSACSGSTAPEQKIDADAERLISLTRETQSTYSLYAWNEITPKDFPPSSNWSAEFHSKTLHRVETPDVRIVADCRAKTGKSLHKESGEIESGPHVAKAACGIQANAKILTAHLIGEKKTAFGTTKSVEILDQFQRRTYDVSPEGVIIASTIGSKSTPSKTWVRNLAIHVESKLPALDIFSEQSLGRSVVAERFRQAPGKQKE